MKDLYKRSNQFNNLAEALNIIVKQHILAYTYGGTPTVFVKYTLI